MNDLSECNVLVVDDTEANIDILVETLGDKYEISVALDGESALEIVEESAPDIILLDIMMPEMDGYEVCRRLKADATTAAIPIIFITAMDKTEDKVKGFQLGGIDYITKPFEVEEVLARVQTHLLLTKAKQQLEQQHQELQKSYSDLKAAESARDSLMHMIVHDMRTPLTGIKGSLDVFDLLFEGELDENLRKLIDNASASSTKLIEMVSSLLDIGRLEAGQMPIQKSENSISEVISEAIAIVGEMARNIELKVELEDDNFSASFDKDLIRRVITNLLANAIKFTPTGSDIRIVAHKNSNDFQISVIDTGPGIPEDLQDRIFQKFGQAELKKEQRGYSSGIGLAFCKLAIEAHEGEIGINSEVGAGSEFFFKLSLN